MTEHERLIVTAAMIVLRDHGERLQTRPFEGAHYAGRQLSHAADEISYALRCYAEAIDDVDDEYAPDSRKVQA